MTQPMTEKRLSEIKARCEAAKSVPGHCKRCKWFTDLPDCLTEIERLKQLNYTLTPVCMYCMKQWPAIRNNDKEAYAALVPDILDHVSQCEKNPLVQEIERFKTACRIAYQGLCTNDEEAQQEAIALIDALEI